MADKTHTTLWGRRVWHVTPIENLETIISDGLKPAIGPRSAELGETVEAIYCFDSPDDLDNAMSNWLGEAFEEDQVLVLLELDVPEDALAGEGAGFEVVIRSPIPVGNIRILSHDIDGFDISQIKPELSEGPSTF